MMPFSRLGRAGLEGVKRATARWIVIGALAFVIGLGAWYAWRQQRIEALYSEATAPWIAFQAEGSHRAVKELGQFGSDDVTQKLKSIALGETEVPPSAPVQVEAIQILGSRKGPDIPGAIAGLLQPHQVLEVRQAVADALTYLPCTDECTAAVLQYFQRVWSGEPNWEDLAKVPPDLAGVFTIKEDVARDEAVLYQTLYKVLKRESHATVRALVKIYGLGTPAPSKFALMMAEKLQLREACADLLKSQKQAKTGDPELFLAPVEQIDSAVRTIGCQ